MVTWLPPLLFVLTYALFAQGVPRELAVGVVDLDKSPLSRKILRTYDASPTLALVRNFTSLAEGVEAMRSTEIYGLVYIGPDTENDVILGKGPVIEGFYNSQYLLMGKLVKAALAEAHHTVAAQIDVLKKLKTGTASIGEAVSQAVPVSTQVTSLYNIGRSYAQFLCSAIIPALWQILIVMVTVYAMGMELRPARAGGCAQWLSDRPFKALFYKLVPYTLIFWLHGVIWVTGLFVYVGWPMHGSFAVLLCALFLTVCACQAVAALIFLLIKDAARSLSSAAAYAAPGLAFMGVTYPVSDMIYPARLWRSLLPASHYIDIQISQTNYGATIMASAPQFAKLLLFVFPAMAAVALAYLIRQRNRAEGRL